MTLKLSPSLLVAGATFAVSVVCLAACDEKSASVPPAISSDPKAETAKPIEPAPPSEVPAAAPGDTPFDPSALLLTPAQRQRAEWALLGQMLRESDPTTLSATAADRTLSPSSLVNALQALWWGTRGETALEVAGLFGVQPGVAAPVAPAQAPNPAVPGLGGSVTLSNASALWMDESFPLLDAYVQLLKERGLGTAETLDWSQTAEALGRINRWASDATGGKIATLFADGEIRPPVAFVLASVVSFKGTWAQAFEAAFTKTEDFVLLDGSRRPVSYLTATRELRHAKVEGGADLLELPFSDGRHRMVIALPGEAGAAALGALEQDCATKMPAWLAELKVGPVSLSVPKFEIGSSFDPKSTLEALGVRSIFSDKDADFSGASEAGGLKLDTIRHHARVRIDENGAEAVAATAASVAPKGILPDPVAFRADHPFLFFILGEGDELLFAGRVALPTTTDQPSDTPRP